MTVVGEIRSRGIVNVPIAGAGQIHHGWFATDRRIEVHLVVAISLKRRGRNDQHRGTKCEHPELMTTTFLDGESSLTSFVASSLLFHSGSSRSQDAVEDSETQFSSCERKSPNDDRSVFAVPRPQECQSTMSSSADFSNIPVLDFALVSHGRDLFISELRHALVNVGFLYLANSPVDKVRLKKPLQISVAYRKFAHYLMPPTRH